MARDGLYENKFIHENYPTVSRPVLFRPGFDAGRRLPLGADAAAKIAFNVRSFGAKGDGKTLDSPAINQAIEAAPQAGGGTVGFRPGTYLSGSIQLKSNIHLLIDAGATILGAPQSMNAYDREEPFRPRPIRTAATPISTTA